MRLIPMITLLWLTPLACADGFCVSPSAAVPDDSEPGLSVPIEVAVGDGAVLDSIEVSLVIAHPWVGDLVVSLTSPAGTAVTLLDRPGIPSTGFPGPFGCGGRDLDAVFSDLAGVGAEDLCAYAPRPVIAGSVMPNEPLARFIGEPAAGVWMLTVSDRSAYDSGVVVKACLLIATSAGCAPDFNGDGNLDFFDVSGFIGAFTAMNPSADLTGDGQINFFDVSAFLSAFNAGCP